MENSNVPFLIVAVYLAGCILIHSQVYEVMPDPYMDEIFHVPQNIRYCDFNSSWDPKITTLPGVYIMTTCVLKPLSFLGIHSLCTVYYLRLWNIVMNAISICVLNRIFIFTAKHTYNPVSSGTNALAAALFPLTFFFNFLFYMDPTANTFFLLMFLYWLEEKYVWSALSGAISVTTRQTSIVWVFYFGFVTLLDGFKYLFREMKVNKKLQARKIFTREVIFSKPIMSVFKKTFNNCLGYVLAGLSFLVFVMLNGGIVVGDKEAHQVTVNFPQLFYFSLFAGALLSPYIPRRFMDTVNLMKRHLNLVLICTIAAIFIVSVNTVAHPYLLADNRHYTFYFWKRIYEANAAFKYLLIPVYMFLWCFIFTSMDIRGSSKLVFFVCCCINFVPQLLLEFRYYIPAYLFIRAHMKSVKRVEVYAEIFLYMVVNIVTLGLFMKRPFHWVDNPETQRFMW